MKINFKNNRNENIVGVLNVPDKKSSEITIIIHGFSSNKDGGSKITANIFTKNKMNSLAIDLDNMGESEPNFEDMTLTKYADTIISAIKYCEQKGFNKVNLIGTSTGGLSVMITALKYPKINSIILRSASPSDAEWYKNYAKRREGMNVWKQKGYMKYTCVNGKKK